MAGYSVFFLAINSYEVKMTHNEKQMKLGVVTVWSLVIICFFCWTITSRLQDNEIDKRDIESNKIKVQNDKKHFILQFLLQQNRFVASVLAGELSF